MSVLDVDGEVLQENKSLYRRRRRSWSSASSTASDSLLGVHVNDEEDEETMRHIERLLMSTSPENLNRPVDENINAYNVLPNGVGFSEKTTLEVDTSLSPLSTGMERVVGTPDSVQRALHLNKQTEQFSDTVEEENTWASNTTTQEGLDTKSESSKTNRSFPSNSMPQTLPNANKWVELAHDLLKSGRKVLSKTSRNELILWCLIICLWAIAVFDPTLVQRLANHVGKMISPLRIPAEAQVETTPNDDVDTVQETASRLLIDEPLPAGNLALPSIEVISPSDNFEIVARGDVKVHLLVSNVYPRMIRLHRRPKVCLRIASTYEDTSIGCMPVTADITEVLLQDVQPGEYTLYVSLMSEVKKLAKTERIFSVSQMKMPLNGQIKVGTYDKRHIHHEKPFRNAPIQKQPLRNVKEDKGEECVTSCTRTCTTVFELDGQDD